MANDQIADKVVEMFNGYNATTTTTETGYSITYGGFTAEVEETTVDGQTVGSVHITGPNSYDATFDISFAKWQTVKGLFESSTSEDAEFLNLEVLTEEPETV